MTHDISEQLTKYLTDAHSIEEQALAQLKQAPGMAGDEELAAAFRAHLTETEEHERTVRRLLEARGAKPSRVKDAVMWVGGKGFLLFAKLQPDTPGKLLAHAFSYEGLELASYELLHAVADRANDGDAALAATRIRNEERAMIQRLEDLFDNGVAASLREVKPKDLTEQLRRYLADAHAIEEQAIALLERAPKIVGDTSLAPVFEDHLAETRDHAERIQERLRALGGDASTWKDAALRLGALNWNAFFQAHPDTPGKLTAFAYAFEHLEIGGYEQLRSVAERAGDDETVVTATGILGEERASAERLAGLFPQAAAASLEAVGASG
jgi:ferritin-like metal-binding protein YciE